MYQLLIKVNNSKTHLLTFPPTNNKNNLHSDENVDATNNDTIVSYNNNNDNVKYDSHNTNTLQSLIIQIPYNQIIQTLSHKLKLPPHAIRIHNIPPSSTHTISLYSRTTFLSAYTFLPILGGKGGFGTLLKGQSKQASARKTLDFGACRDLNGRRLRHVNDEIKLRKWREMIQYQQQVEQYENRNMSVEEELQFMATASGIRNWHLMVPKWSEMAGGGGGGGSTNEKMKKKMEREIQKELERNARRLQNEQDKKLHAKQSNEQARDAYVNVLMEQMEKNKQNEAKMMQSILEIMKKKKMKKRKRDVNDIATDADANIDATDDTSQSQQEQKQDTEKEDDCIISSFVTLSGDIITDTPTNHQLSSSPSTTISTTKKQPIMVQSKSDFATAAIILSLNLLPSTSSKENEKLPQALYYEIIIQTGGLAQIGWADISNSLDLESSGSTTTTTATTQTTSTTTSGDGFHPNSDTGDGVGDDSYSYGYDGSRGLFFYDGKEIPYGVSPSTSASSSSKSTPWKEGDVIGCMYNFQTGTIEYSINGINLGIAYTTTTTTTAQKQERKMLHPAFSLNQDEVLMINIGPEFQFKPQDDSIVGVDTMVDDGNNNNILWMKEEQDDLVGSEKQTVAGDILENDNSKSGNTQPAASKDSQPSTQNLKPPSTSLLSSPPNNTIETSQPKPIDLNEYNSARELEGLGMERLKEGLMALGCKCGGSLQERANRLFSLKGLNRSEYPTKVLAKSVNPIKF